MNCACCINMCVVCYVYVVRGVVCALCVCCGALCIYVCVVYCVRIVFVSCL